MATQTSPTAGQLWRVPHLPDLGACSLLVLCRPPAESRGHAPTAATEELRHDHGNSFMANHFHRQIKFRGITPSCAFVGEPQTNGVIERVFRTFKEQVMHGRIYQAINDVRDAFRVFVDRYNTQ